MAATATLLSAVTSTGAGSTVSPVSSVRAAYENGLVQVDGITTATVAIQGSLDNTNWHTLVSFAADGVASVKLFPYMRGNVTAYTSGTITVLLESDPS